MTALLLSAVLCADVSLYAPTPPEAVVAMLELAEVEKDDVLYDLGCGDGRVLAIASSIYRCRSVGIEIDQRLAETAERNIARNRVGLLARVVRGDVLGTEFQDATVITCYFLPDLLKQLIPRFETLRDGVRIVCYQEALPGIKPNKTVTLPGELGTVYLYIAPLAKDCKT